MVTLLSQTFSTHAQHAPKGRHARRQGTGHHCLVVASGTKLGLCAQSRPIALHSVRKKLVMTVFSLHFKPIFQQLAHPGQVGSFTSCQMGHQTYGVKGLFDMLPNVAPVTFDFANVFPMLSYSFTQAVLDLLQIPNELISVMISIMRAPYQFFVGNAVIKDHVFHPQIGMGHCDPFLRVLLCFCASLLLRHLHEMPGLSKSSVYTHSLAR